MIRFHEEWVMKRDLETTWRLFEQAFTDSAELPSWPNRLVSLKARAAALRKDAAVKAVYRTGPLRRTAVYRITELDSPKAGRARIGYETSEKHVLRGAAKLTLSSEGTGSVRCAWTGEYRPRGVPGRIAEAWFRLYFRAAFFEAIEKRLRPAVSERKKAGLKAAEKGPEKPATRRAG